MAMTGRRLQEGGNREQGDVSARRGTLSIGSKPVGGRDRAVSVRLRSYLA